jgi:hypothetical protein|uniref:Uncharacterized protein n=1 Tax=viral metagenome TaxID=1070528 RepID=A0A6C0IWT8_9ZZZZ
MSVPYKKISDEKPSWKDTLAGVAVSAESDYNKYERIKLIAGLVITAMIVVAGLILWVTSEKLTTTSINDDGENVILSDRENYKMRFQ